MSFEFGIFHEFSRSPGQTDAEAFAQSFAQVDAAERWGLDVVWLAELHFLPERSVVSAPLVVATAIAARTRRLKVGIAVQVLPCHPLRLAEEVATLDHLSGGRLIFGVGRSGFPRTYEAYGVPYAEPPALRGGARVLKRAWSNERFSFEGDFYKFRDITLVPRPLQKPYPPLRIAATSADTYPAIGAMGLPIFVAVRLGTIELGPNIAAYREAYRRRPCRRGRSTCACPSMSARRRLRRAPSPSSRSCSSTGRSASRSRPPRRGPGRAIEQRAERGTGAADHQLRGRAARQGDRRNA